MIHQPLSPDGVHPQVSSSLRLLVFCLVRPDLLVINYCLFFQITDFFHWLPCHSSVFNALILFKIVCLRNETTWSLADCVDQDHTAQKAVSGLRSTISYIFRLSGEDHVEYAIISNN